MPVPMKSFTQTLLLVLCLSVPSALADARSVFEVLDLRHRPAAELIPLIEPLLGPEDAVTGAGMQLILRTTPARLAEVRMALDRLDAPAVNLIVSVRRGSRDLSRERELQLSGPLGPVIAGEASRGQILYRRTGDRDSGVQTLRVLEGQVALIRTGEVVPRLRHGPILFPGGAVIGPGIDDRELERGFLVRPLLAGDGRVRLEIRQVHERESRAGGGRIDVQSVDTVLVGGLGEWIRVAGVEEQRVRSEQRILGTRREQGEDETEIHVRVDLAQ